MNLRGSQHLESVGFRVTLAVGVRALSGKELTHAEEGQP